LIILRNKSLTQPRYKQLYLFLKMKKIILLLLCLFVGLSSYAAPPEHSYIRITVNNKECIVQLSNLTPKHRDNFIKLVKEGIYDSTLFHRVIKDFMIQGGDPDSKGATAGTLLGEGDLGYTIPAEFNDSLFHKKGALAAARDDNPEKVSNSSQFYLVQGKKYTAKELDRIEELKLKGQKIPGTHRKVYETLGGSPFLDHNYTVFGEVVKGIDFIDSIAALPTDSNDRPLQNQIITMEILTPLAVRKLEAELKGEPYKPSIFRRFLDLFAKDNF
jgi:cyclophilin family peptidyl-prolyl cis-trans isomerase